MTKKKRFSSVAAVFRFLEAEGYRVSRSTVFSHVKEKKLRSDRTGGFPLEAVEKYATAFLTKREAEEETDALQRRRLRATAALLEEKLKTAQRAAQREQENWVSRDTMILELCSRAGIFKAGLENLSFQRLAAWREAPTHQEAEQMFIDDIHRLLNELADIESWVVIFEDDRMTVKPNEGEAHR
jgi:hypothetical protein